MSGEDSDRYKLRSPVELEGVEPVLGQDLTSLLRAHERSFTSFGGVPEVIRHDDLKAAVVRACLYDPDVSELYSTSVMDKGGFQ